MSSAAASTEAAIELASLLKEGATSIRDAYALLPAVLDKELRAIKSGVLASVEAVGVEKAEIGDRIEVAYVTLSAAAERINRLVSQSIDGHTARCVSLQECLAALELLSESLPTGGLGPQVLRHQLSGIRSVTESLTAAVLAIKPLVESNKTLLQTMLESYQESYRFWQNVAEETAAAYTPKGVQQAAGRTSAFRARA